ncbi:MaoC family dehydratase [Tomitella fengzijianii]|nr:MaoC family dehydratase [Tomitella fengzijianii]
MADRRVGETLPESHVPITATLIASGAIATRDFQRVHHDRDAAQAAGTKDIFMNILTTNGLVTRYLTEWAGPSARMKKLSIGLGAPNFPGDEMTLTGVVEDVADDGTVRVSVQGRNSLGTHVSAQAHLAFHGAEVLENA